MALWADNITDLVNSTLEELGEGKISDLATSLQEYTAMERLVAQNQVSVKGGTSCRFNVITQGDGNTRTTSMFGVDNVDHVDGTQYGDVAWRGVTTGMSFDINQTEINSGPRQLVDFLKEKRYMRDISWFDATEGYFWDGPASSSDSLTPFGLLKYWLDYSASTGFNGGNHTNFSAGPAGLSCSTYTNWQHYTANYSSASTDSDLPAKLRKAVRYTNFKGIPNKPISDYAKGAHRFGIYTTGDTLEGLETLARAQNENLGSELGMYQDAVVIKRVPIEWVPYLENNHATSDPVIGIDWSVMEVVALQNRWRVETPFATAPNQHTVRVSFLDSVFNFICRDRRRLFLIAKSDPMSD